MRAVGKVNTQDGESTIRNIPDEGGCDRWAGAGSQGGGTGRDFDLRVSASVVRRAQVKQK